MDAMTLFFVATTILGIVLTIYYGRKSSALERARKSLEWPDMQSAAADLGAQVSRFDPDVIVTPGLRGATFVNLLAGFLARDIPVFVGVSSWKGSSTPIVTMVGYLTVETNKWYVHVDDDLKQFSDKRVLIVDDFVMSGDFIEKLRGRLVAWGFSPANVKSLAVATTKVAVQNHKGPDYWWMQASDDSFYFPWGKAR